jgi:hypothetical protein
VAHAGAAACLAYLHACATSNELRDALPIAGRQLSVAVRHILVALSNAPHMRMRVSDLPPGSAGSLTTDLVIYAVCAGVA